MKKWGFLVSKYSDGIDLISYSDEEIGVLYDYTTPDEEFKTIARLIEIEKYYPSLD